MIAIIVPCRLQSERFPQKLLYPIHDKPLVRWTAERIAEQVPELPLFFAVDSGEIANALKGFEVIHTSVSHLNGTSRVAEANDRVCADKVINIQADEPLVTATQIDALIDGLNYYRVATIASPEEFDRNDPNLVKVNIDYHHRALYFSRQPIPASYHHIGMYGYEASFLERYVRMEPGRVERAERLEQLRILEHGYPIGVELVDCPHLAVDVPGDIAKLEQWL